MATLGQSISGVRGKVLIGTNRITITPGAQDAVGTVAVGNIIRWSATIAREILDASTFEQQYNARRKLGGMMSLTGSVEGRMDNINLFNLIRIQTEDVIVDTAPGVGDPAWFDLYTIGTAGSTLGYRFQALVSNIRMDTPKNGWATFTLDFQSDGDITIPAAAP